MSPVRIENRVLLGGIVVVLLVLAFAGLSDLVSEGRTQQFDERVLRALRQPDDPATPIGPRWIQYAAVDITALGSGWVIGLIVFAIVGFLALQGMRRTALFVLIATSSGSTLNTVLKLIFQRPRPEVVPHLSDVLSLSFPSGHALTSAVVYLTLGALLTRIAKRRATKVYCLAMAMFLTVLIGSTRVYLGVHYPTDVLAGWLLGLCWALVCLSVERTLEKRAGLRRELAQNT